MKCTTELREGRTVLVVGEERLDASNSGDLRETMLGILEPGGQQLVIDLSQVNFIDSSGLGALLSGFKSANLRSGSLVLAGLQSRVQSMFELTRLHRVFDIYSSVDDALANAG
jgi:anti-sigma B factor antagonist